MTFLGLIAHLVGDYVLQNHHMANGKIRPGKEGWYWTLLHVTLYSIPFLMIGVPLAGVLIVAGTHAVIDHYRLATYWCQFWGVGNNGYLALWSQEQPFDGVSTRYEAGVGWYVWNLQEHGYVRRGLNDAPDYLRVWLLILVDNITHVAINTAVIVHYFGI